MKIVHCIWSFNTGGAETMLVDIANEQAKTLEVCVLIVNDSFQQYLVDKFSPEVKVVLNHRKPNSRSILPFIRLNRTLRKLRPDVVHLHNAMLAKVVMPWVSRGLFLTVHDLHLPLGGVRRGVKLIAISEAVKEDVLRRGNYDIVVIPNGIDVKAIDKRDLHGLERNMHIVQVARLDVQKKGQDILIDALALLKKRGIENIDIDFIGEGASEQVLKMQVEKLGISDRVHFLGLCDRNYIYKHLKDYDLMCHPSRYEGFGLTVAEGMAAMVPVLVPDNGGPYEIIENGKLGMVFKMGNVEDCADKIEYIYNHYQKLGSLVSQAYKKTCECYSIERMVREYIRFYDKILSV